MKVCPLEMLFEQYSQCRKSTLDARLSKSACSELKQEVEQCEATR